MKQLGYLCVVLVLLGLLPATLPEDLAPVNLATAQPADMLARTVSVTFDTPGTFQPAWPVAVFNPTQMFNSGTIGTFPGPDMTFALTFWRTR